MYNKRESSGSSTGSKPAMPFKRQLFQRRKTCPFSGSNAVAIDYKDVRMLSRFITERGKIIPRRISSVSTKKQRELAQAIKRARFLALLPYVND
jgi:small subunit ribosomal protein S18